MIRRLDDVRSSRGAGFPLAGLLAAALLASASAALAQTTIRPPAALNHNAVIDIGSNNDESVDLATDEDGTWIAVWHAPANDTTIDCTGSLPRKRQGSPVGA